MEGNIQLMNQMLFLRINIFNIVILLYLITYSFYCLKYYLSKNNFIVFALFSLLHVIFGLVTEVTVNMPDCPVFINDICHILFFVFALAFCLELFKYSVNIVYPKNKTEIPTVVAYLISGIAILITSLSNIEYRHGNGTMYSAGVGPTICYGAACSMFIVSVFLLVFNHKKIQRHIVFALLPMTLVSFVFLIVQIFVPEFLFTGADITLVLIGAFFAIENPIGKFEDRANIDMDTHARNRNCYEKDFEKLKARIREDKIEYPLIYVICDLNGLKTVNDNYGHLEGDKLITTAAEILMEQLKDAQNVYRIGGDEFVALFEGVKISVVEEQIALVNVECEKASKNLVTPLTISIGYAVYTQGDDIEDVVRSADETMYANKDAYYKNKGLNRRKIKDSFNVIRDACTKMVRVNLTKDNFKIININLEEKKKETGFSEVFSEWVKGFADAGYVYQDDLELFNDNMNIDYLRNCFTSKKENVSFIYRRKYSGDFFKTFVEFIPADEYRDDNQIVFCYVKNLHQK